LVSKACNLIIPALQDGKTVILDRYTICNKVYTHLNGADTVMIDLIHRSLPEPDLYLYLDLNWETAWNRIIKRGQTVSPKEHPDQLQRAVELYEEHIARLDGKVKRLDASLTEADLLNSSRTKVVVRHTRQLSRFVAGNFTNTPECDF
jgi:thymidylate kinase